MTAYILTPINETDNLPTGWYVCIASGERSLSDPSDIENQYFANGKWGTYIRKRITHYFRPLTDVVVLNRSQIQEIWDAAGNCNDEIYRSAYEGEPYNELIPDKQTTIDNLFNKQQ